MFLAGDFALKMPPISKHSSVPKQKAIGSPLDRTCRQTSVQSKVTVPVSARLTNPSYILNKIKVNESKLYPE